HVQSTTPGIEDLHGVCSFRRCVGRRRPACMSCSTRYWYACSTERSARRAHSRRRQTVVPGRHAGQTPLRARGVECPGTSFTRPPRRPSSTASIPHPAAALPEAGSIFMARWRPANRRGMSGSLENPLAGALYSDAGRWSQCDRVAQLFKTPNVVAFELGLLELIEIIGAQFVIGLLGLE